VKRAIALVLVSVMAFSCVGLIACGDGEEGGTTQPDNGGTTQTASEDGSSSNDIPVYPGANQTIDTGSITIPVDEDEWSEMEWHYYATGDSVNKVVSFYQSEMPDSGWQEMGWMNMGLMTGGTYTKNNEQDVAMVRVGSEEGRTIIIIMRATR